MLYSGFVGNELLAQSVEHLPFKEGVPGSNPGQLSVNTVPSSSG